MVRRSLVARAAATGLAVVVVVVAVLFFFTLTPPLSSPFETKKTKQNKQLEEELQDDLKWSIEVKKVLHSGKSDFQSVELVDSGPFGKVRETEEGDFFFRLIFFRSLFFFSFFTSSRYSHFFFSSSPI